MARPVCLVTGVGPRTGTGGEIAARFASGGYQVAMLARDADNLAALEQQIEGATAFPCDVGDLDALTETIINVRDRLGEPEIVIHNALRSVRGGILELDPEDLERNFRVNTTALLYLARATIPAMVENGKGTILITGNTSATRGKTNWGFFASTKAAQRILAESIAREFGPKGIHTAYIMIDASIDTPRTRPVLAPDKPDNFFAKPKAIADEMFHITHQDKSAWSFLVELRPFGEVW
ncbi:MAG: SDR family NAD(P)-dependent oxidoreductase [Alphaproteobacteria bacterium]|nr:SDR family NAD(P)-dependent oxidoreductase [Alphaproteobacteria bacterium]MDG1887414.1 SDR family NAD(P)-dependent oxidoreductase [Alphaproteobacteria bacterium]